MDDMLRAYLLRIEWQAEQDFADWLWNVQAHKSFAACYQLLICQIRLQIVREIVRDVWRIVYGGDGIR